MNDSLTIGLVARGLARLPRHQHLVEALAKQAQQNLLQEGLAAELRQRLVAAEAAAPPAGENDRAGLANQPTLAAKIFLSAGVSRTNSNANFACPRA